MSIGANSSKGSALTGQKVGADDKPLGGITKLLGFPPVDTGALGL